ncbi:MAG: DUF427 domain-containing protein [Pseudomonadota bacterium]
MIGSPPLRLVSDARRFRAYAGGALLADSCRAQLLCEAGLHPVVYFPPGDVDVAALEQRPGRTSCPFKGEAEVWGLRRRPDLSQAAWRYPEPKPAVAALAGHFAFAWRALESFWQEDQRLLAHPRNPFVRIDTLTSQRRVQVTAGGQRLADSQAAVLLFETDLPLRPYLSPQDLRMDLLVPSSSRSVCPYKGEARYFDLQLDGRQVKDVAWTYSDPFAEVALIKDRICFFPEMVDSITIADA